MQGLLLALSVLLGAVSAQDCTSSFSNLGSKSYDLKHFSNNKLYFHALPPILVNDADGAHIEFGPGKEVDNGYSLDSMVYETKGGKVVYNYEVSYTQKVNEPIEGTNFPKKGDMSTLWNGDCGKNKKYILTCICAGNGSGPVYCMASDDTQTPISNEDFESCRDQVKKAYPNAEIEQLKT